MKPVQKSKIVARISPEMGAKLKKIISESGQSESDLIRTGLMLLFTKHKTPASIAEAVFRTTRMVKIKKQPAA